MKFEHLKNSDGLSQSNVLCMLQDSRGFMWFGTREGLNKYDGYRFTVYKNDPKNKNSISHNYIQDIAQSKNGDLWLATQGGGLSRYDRRKDLFVNYRNSPKDKNSVSNDLLNSVLADSKDKVWIGTVYGLDMYDPQKNLFTHYKHDTTGRNTFSLSADHIKKVFEDSKGNILGRAL